MGKLCETCKYYGTTIKCCDYAEMTGKLRTVENGKIVKNKGRCKQYEKRIKNDTNWAVTKSTNWYKTHGT